MKRGAVACCDGGECDARQRGTQQRSEQDHRAPEPHPVCTMPPARPGRRPCTGRGRRSAPRLRAPGRIRGASAAASAPSRRCPAQRHGREGGRGGRERGRAAGPPGAHSGQSRGAQRHGEPGNPTLGAPETVGAYVGACRRASTPCMRGRRLERWRACECCRCSRRRCCSWRSCCSCQGGLPVIIAAWRAKLVSCSAAPYDMVLVAASK